MLNPFKKKEPSRELKPLSDMSHAFGGEEIPESTPWDNETRDNIPAPQGGEDLFGELSEKDKAMVEGRSEVQNQYAEQYNYPENIKEEVGYPEGDTSQKVTDLPRSIEDVSELNAELDKLEEEELGEVAPAVPDNFEEAPHSITTAPAQASAPKVDDFHNIARSVADGIKQELEDRIQKLNDEVLELKKLDKQIKSMVDTMQKIERDYKKFEKNTRERMTEYGKDLRDVKNSTQLTEEILKTALPALIHEVKGISEKKKE